MTSLYCVIKLKVSCHYASIIGDFNNDSFNTEESQSSLIDGCVEKHLKVLDLIEMIDLIYQFISLAQIVSTLGFFVAICFQTRFGINFYNIVIFVAVLFQLFCYCFFGELVSSMVSEIVYCDL